MTYAVHMRQLWQQGLLVSSCGCSLPFTDPARAFPGAGASPRPQVPLWC
jgi:hypothetical protein